MFTVLESALPGLHAWASGLFDDIKAYKEKDVLVFKVVERPVISKLEFKGNKLIPKEALEQGLKKMGIVEGEVFKKSALQTIETELEQQYNHSRVVMMPM